MVKGLVCKTMICRFDSDYELFMMPEHAFKQELMKSLPQDEDVVMKRLIKEDFKFRIASRDGTGYALTQDYLPKRANLNIEYGKVVSIVWG